MAGEMEIVGNMQRGFEQHDLSTIVQCYADDAEVRIIDHDHPPSSPLHLSGRQEIENYYRDILSRDMEHRLSGGIGSGDSVAFAEECEYSDGTHVFASELCHLKDGRIHQQTIVQAWDH